MQTFFRALTVVAAAFCFTTTLSSTVAYAESSTTADASTAVTVTDEQIAAVAEACAAGADSAACVTAVNALVAELKAKNPGLKDALAIGSIAAKIASTSNDAVAGKVTINVGGLADALTVLADVAKAAGSTGLATALLSVGKLVAAGLQVDLGAVAAGTGRSLLDDLLASPT